MALSTSGTLLSLVEILFSENFYKPRNKELFLPLLECKLVRESAYSSVNLKSKSPGLKSWLCYLLPT